MSECKHEAIKARVFEDTLAPAGMWSCEDCGHKFVPLDLEMERDAARYRYLRNRNAEHVLTSEGPSAGIWIDCEDTEGTLILLTGEDADQAIDAEMKKQ